MARRPPTSASNPAELVAKARASLHQEGSVRLTALGPPAVRASLKAELAREGFEVTRSFVRRPLGDQLLDRLGRGESVPMKAGHVPRGATIAEVRRAAVELVKAGKAHIVLLTSAETLIGAGEDVLTTDELRSTREMVAALGKQLQVATRRGSLVTLRRAELASLVAALPLRGGSPQGAGQSLCATAVAGSPKSQAFAGEQPPHSDATIPALSQVAECAGSVEASVVAAQPSSASMMTARATPNGSSSPVWTEESAKALLRAVEGARDDRMGLSFVPRIVRALEPDWDVQSAHKLLLEACRRGLVELRPESGLGRLSEEELHACPPGPQGTRLSWARRLPDD